MTLQTFSSGDSVEWIDWRQHYETLADHCGWDDDAQRRQLKAAMQGEAAARVRDIRVADHANIGAMLAAFEERFIPQAETMLTKAEFDQARQTPGEKLLDWHGRLRSLFMRAYPNRNAANDDQLIRGFTAGILDPAIKMFVLEGAPDTYNAALTRAQNKEAMLLTIKQMGQVNLGANANRRGVHALSAPGETINFVGGAAGKDNRKVVCFFCRKSGHTWRDCFILKRAEAFLKRTKDENDPLNQNKGKKRNGNGKGRKVIQTMEQANPPHLDVVPADANFQKAVERLPDSFFEDISQ